MCPPQAPRLAHQLKSRAAYVPWLVTDRAPTTLLQQAFRWILLALSRCRRWLIVSVQDLQEYAGYDSANPGESRCLTGFEIYFN